MSEQIDWSKAPEGATHYLAENKKHGWFACWYKYGSNEWLCMSDSNRHGWIADNDDVELFEPMLIKRPTTPSWSGEGLPPVGAVCEMKYCGEWEKTEILCIGVKHVFIRQIAVTGEAFECSLNLSACQFRPIRTPEQIAADEREAAIKEIASVINIANCMDCGTHTATALYDAGYRKP